MDQKCWRLRMTKRDLGCIETYFVVVVAETEDAAREKMNRFINIKDPKRFELGDISEIPSTQSSTGILIAGGIRNHYH